MKKIFMLFIVVLSLILSFGVMSCDSNISAEELEVCGRYNLTKVEGLEDISADSYLYNYMVLKDDNTFTLQNKHGELDFSSKGKWNLSGETLTLKLSGLFTQKEKHRLIDGVIYLSGDLDGKSISMEFTKSESQ